MIFFNAGNKWFDCKIWLLTFGIYIYIFIYYFIYIYIYHILFIPTTTFNVYYVTMTFVIFCFWAPQFCRWNRFGVWELGKSRHFNLHISTFGFPHFTIYGEWPAPATQFAPTVVSLLLWKLVDARDAARVLVFMSRTWQRRCSGIVQLPVLIAVDVAISGHSGII